MHSSSLGGGHPRSKAVDGDVAVAIAVLVDHAMTVQEGLFIQARAVTAMQDPGDPVTQGQAVMAGAVAQIVLSNAF